MKILFATDGSEYATRAAHVLSQLSAKQPIELTVLTVTYLPDNLRSGTVKPWYGEWRKAEDQRIQEHYAHLAPLLQKHDGAVAMLQKDGNPTHEILETAEEIQADLIVIGARGHSSLERILVGSVSDAVATHAHCSVLVVRPESHATEEGQPPSFHRLTVAFDGSQRAESAVQHLQEFDWSEDSCQMEVVTVIPELDVFGQEYAVRVQMDDHESELQQQAMVVKEALGQCCQAVGLTLLRERHIGDALVRSAEKSDADVIVMGDSGHSALGRLLMGSTSKYVLRHAGCSVWISRLGVTPQG